MAAAITQPAHVVDLIASVPTGDLEAIRTWIKRASWIESYREQWGVEPERLRERPLDACQGQEWDRSVHLAEILARPLPDDGPQPRPRDGAWLVMPFGAHCASLGDGAIRTSRRDEANHARVLGPGVVCVPEEYGYFGLSCLAALVRALYEWGVLA